VTGPYLPGDAALARSRGVVAWGIRVGTRSRFNHVRWVVDTDGKALEAMGKGAVWGRVRPGDLVVRPPMTDEQRAKVPDVAAMLYGRGYGWLGVIALGLAQFGIRPAWVRRRIQRRDELFCSQLVDYGWELTGFHAYTDGRIPQDVSPGDEGDLAFRSGWKVVAA
jgi:hypothetical protein